VASPTKHDHETKGSTQLNVSGDLHHITSTVIIV